MLTFVSFFLTDILVIVIVIIMELSHFRKQTIDVLFSGIASMLFTLRRIIRSMFHHLGFDILQCLEDRCLSVPNESSTYSIAFGGFVGITICAVGQISGFPKMDVPRCSLSFTGRIHGWFFDPRGVLHTFSDQRFLYNTKSNEVLNEQTKCVPDQHL
jgi:hypothetical protein